MEIYPNKYNDFILMVIRHYMFVEWRATNENLIIFNWREGVVVLRDDFSKYSYNTKESKRSRGTLNQGRQQVRDIGGQITYGPHLSYMCYIYAFFYYLWMIYEMLDILNHDLKIILHIKPLTLILNMFEHIWYLCRFYYIKKHIN